MTRLLLDHPWPIDAALDAGSQGYKVLLEFDRLLKRRCLLPVPFVEQHDYYVALEQLKGNKSSGAAAVRRLAFYLIRNGVGIVRATPIPELNLPNLPPSECWKYALRDELEYPENWRNPQIIFPKVRQEAWPHTDEIEIKCADRDGTVSRVLASLEEYESHKYAISDIDPWRNLEWLKRPQPRARVNYPCRLPKPPILEGVHIDRLVEMLGEARRIGCRIDEGKYYYIPSADWQPEITIKAQWRDGYAFPHKSIPGWKGPILIDYRNIEWRWDMKERHWDVQTDPYISVSHTGELL